MQTAGVYPYCKTTVQNTKPVQLKKCLLVLLVFKAGFSAAQDDSLKKWIFSGYGEIYYSYDFSNPQDHEKESFIYNHKRHNEINANLLVVKAGYTDRRYRANLGLMAGNR